MYLTHTATVVKKQAREVCGLWKLSYTRRTKEGEGFLIGHAKPLPTTTAPICSSGHMFLTSIMTIWVCVPSAL